MNWKKNRVAVGFVGATLVAQKVLGLDLLTAAVEVLESVGVVVVFADLDAVSALSVGVPGAAIRVVIVRNGNAESAKLE